MGCFCEATRQRDRCGSKSAIRNSANVFRFGLDGGYQCRVYEYTPELALGDGVANAVPAKRPERHHGSSRGVLMSFPS